MVSCPNGFTEINWSQFRGGVGRTEPGSRSQAHTGEDGWLWVGVGREVRDRELAGGSVVGGGVWGGLTSYGVSQTGTSGAPVTERYPAKSGGRWLCRIGQTGVVVLHGRVTAGIGGHAHWMTIHADLYEAKTGVRLYPGTLNVVLDHSWHVGGRGVRLEPPEYGVGLSIVPCTINGIDAFILRTDKNDQAEGDHSPNIVEVAATVLLRDSLGLDDGHEVEIVVADEGSA
jgi:hypothetical protein